MVQRSACGAIMGFGITDPRHRRMPDQARHSRPPAAGPPPRPPLERSTSMGSPRPTRDPWWLAPACTVLAAVSLVLVTGVALAPAASAEAVAGRLALPVTKGHDLEFTPVTSADGLASGDV